MADYLLYDLSIESQCQLALYPVVLHILKTHVISVSSQYQVIDVLADLIDSPVVVDIELVTMAT